MSFEAALEARLLAQPALTALIGAGFSWGRRMTAMPWLTAAVVADPRPQTFNGFQSSRPTDVQFDAWGLTANEVDAIRDVLIAIAVPAFRSGPVLFQRGMVTNSRGGSDLEQGGEDELRAELHRRSIDIRFFHNC